MRDWDVVWLIWQGTAELLYMVGYGYGTPSEGARPHTWKEGSCGVGPV